MTNASHVSFTDLKAFLSTVQSDGICTEDSRHNRQVAVRAIYGVTPAPLGLTRAQVLANAFAAMSGSSPAKVQTYARRACTTLQCVGAYVDDSPEFDKIMSKTFRAAPGKSPKGPKAPKRVPVKAAVPAKPVTPASKPATPAPSAVPTPPASTHQVERTPIMAKTPTTSTPTRALRTVPDDTGVLTSIMSVTPALAAGYLARNVCNRPLNAAAVRVLAQSMTDGKFGLTHQGIGFNVDGDMVDGQHRCTAIVASGVTVEMMVSFNLPRESFTQIDINRRRTASDTLSLIGEKDTIFLAALLRGVHLYDTSLTAQWTGPSSKVDNMRSLDLLKAYPAVRDARHMARQMAKATGLMDTSCGVGIFLTERANPGVDLTDWYQGLLTGANLKPGDARLALLRASRNLASGKDQTRRRTTRLHLSYYLKTFNAWATNQPRQQIRAGQLDELPVPAKVRVTRLSAA